MDAIDVRPTGRVLDIGCGRAALLLRIVERTGASGVGVDPADAALDLARGDAAGRVPAERIDFRCEEFDATRFAPSSFDVVLCIGSTHAAGGLTGTLAAARRLLVGGGVAVIGEGFWHRAPDPGYLAVLGAGPNDLLTHEGNLAACRAARFEVASALVSSPADFDRYEDRHAANLERFVAACPDDPHAEGFAERIRAWRAAYLRWGRDTLGFALYVLRAG